MGSTPNLVAKDASTSIRLSRQRTSGTKPGEKFASLLLKRGYRLDFNVSDLPGRPDIVLPRQNIAIFVHGCFWHGCIKHGTLPKNNRDWWAEKIANNRLRDRRKAAALGRLGWHVITVWEHNSDDQCLRRIRKMGKSGQN